MKKRLLSGVLCILFLLPFSAANAATKSMGNFQKTLEYDSYVFADIADRWFEDYVASAYEFGMAEGRSGGIFAPDENISVAEAIVMAARINSVYYGKKIYSQSGAWYTKYISYAMSAGIMRANQFNKYTRDATRQELAVLFYKALPMQEYAKINDVDAIPDFNINALDAQAIYGLYRAGVLTGDADGHFRPKDTVTRAEAAVILVRAIDPGRRVAFNPVGAGAGPDNLAYFIKVNAAGQITASILLNASTASFVFETYTATITGAVEGKFESDTRSIICVITGNRMGSLPGSDVGIMYFTITPTGLMLSSLVSESGATVTIGDLSVGDAMHAAR